MSLEKILQALELEAAEELAEIERIAELEIARLRAEAEAGAVEVLEKHRSEMEIRLKAERARILNQAKLDALRTVMGVREELIEAAFEAAASRLAVLPERKSVELYQYELAFTGFVCEVASVLAENGDLCLRAESRDLPLLVRIVQQHGLLASVEEGVTGDDTGWNCRGGVIAMSADGRITLANTLSVRLQRAATLYRSEVANFLFGELPAQAHAVLSSGS